MKVVLDTNVILSGLMHPGSTPGRIMHAWIEESHFDLVTSVYQLAEIGRVLSYPKILRILEWDDQLIEQFIKQLYLRAETIDPDITGVEVPQDPADAPILAILLACNAEVLVTGDQDLLALREHHSIETPAEFIRRL